MGGRPPSKRSQDRQSKRWLELYGYAYPYRWTTTLPVTQEFLDRIQAVMGYNFIGKPFPGKNQIVWCFEEYKYLRKFKDECLDMALPPENIG